MLGRFLGTYLMSKMEARKVLSYYCMAAVALVALAYVHGRPAWVSFASCSLISARASCSQPFLPLATKGLPPAESKLASSLVIMAIVGGAVLPPIAGLLSQYGRHENGVVFVPFACFSYVVWYVLKGAESKVAA
jgi:FHS family L-fucose permease-like MFS transporter